MAINGVNNDKISTEASKVENSNSSLGKDDFLKLLIAQLANQDPTDPMEDREFIAQMAQFTSLEQMTNISKQLEDFSYTNRASAANYVGRMVAFQMENAEGVAGEAAGIVVAAWFDPEEGTIFEVQLSNKETIDVPLKQITGVSGYAS